MRKLILISAFVLASVSAHAGESRNMTLAANDETKAVETACQAGRLKTLRLPAGQEVPC